MSRVDGRPAPVRPERRYRRANQPAAPTNTAPRVLQPPTAASITDHLAARHGFGPGHLGGYSLHQLVQMHDAEHRLRGEFVGHTHDRNAGVVLTADEEIHRATLRRIAEGKNPPDIADILDRVDGYIAQRRTEGLPLSPYDRRCVEIAQAVAERAARRARRRGSAA